eukprot:c4028_g1_i1.p1 GENE.c4028_g1_i1~~c4028_g1_i1.p1  ORF type:complete len:399 (-),score=112.76 c4028_g1_i1:92-1231(-)
MSANSAEDAQLAAAALEMARQNVLLVSEEMAPGARVVRGPDFNKVTTADEVMAMMSDIGFQATSLGLSVDEINKMINWKLSDQPLTGKETEAEKDPKYRENTHCTIFLGMTSNMMSCGVREVVKFLAEHKLIDCIVITCGGVEEDLMKCMKPFYHGDFILDGADLRSKGINRIGNLLVPNNNYLLLEDWMQPILDQMLIEQKRDGKIWSPASMIDRFGKEINNEESVWYWCHKNSIPVFCPALTDGAIGDNIYFHRHRNPGLILDIAQDVWTIDNLAIRAKQSGMIILGGGVVKHHICNANMMRNGADYCVFINTGNEFDGSDTGAKPDEAKSWGKIKAEATPVKIYTDASLVFPLIVSQTFAKAVREGRGRAAKKPAN